MKSFVRVLALLVFGALLLSPLAVYAQEKVTSEVVMKTGNMLHLFHSGTADVKKEICLGDVIPVYRETPTGGHLTIKKVGEVKVLSYAGKHYFEAQVVKGEIKVGDIAEKKGAFCLVQPIK